MPIKLLSQYNSMEFFFFHFWNGCETFINMVVRVSTDKTIQCEVLSLWFLVHACVSPCWVYSKVNCSRVSREPCCYLVCDKYLCLSCVNRCCCLALFRTLQCLKLFSNPCNFMTAWSLKYWKVFIEKRFLPL